MRFKGTLALVLMFCGLSITAHAAWVTSDAGVVGVQVQQRVGVVTGYHALFERACQRICAPKSQSCVAQCLHENLPPEVATLQAIEEDADDDAMHCIQAGGLIVERMPACSDSIEALMRLDGTVSSINDMIAAIAAFGDHCSADVLCEGLDMPAY